MTHVLKLVGQRLEVEDMVDNFQLFVFSHKHFGSQHLGKVRNVDEFKVGSYVPFICENNQEEKLQLER